MKMVCKLIAGCAALVLCMSSGTYFNVEASSIYGDVNNNGVVDISDVSALNLYLSGARSASSINMRYADVDQNTVIDVNDIKTLRAYINHNISSLPFGDSGNMHPECTDYTVPSDRSIQYIKYDCATTNTTDYSLNRISTVSLMSGNIDDREIDSSGDATSIVYLEYTKSNGGRYRGTGFIVDDHVIATCAHCLYDGSAFNTDYAIKIYAADGTTLLNTLTAKEIHIPASYMTNTGSGQNRYDYGLIYVSQNLSQYGKISLGVATNYFTNTSSNVSISGFPTTVNNSSAGITRYTGNGIVKNTSDNYFLDTEAYGSGGDSGGPMYIEYTLENATFRSAIGIYKGHYDTLPRYSTGVRITTPILRFYMNNSHIG